MRWVAIPLGFALIFTVLWEAFETIILPRRVQRKLRLTRFFYVFTWLPWRALARSSQNKKRRDSLLGVYGPASLLCLFMVWVSVIVFAYALILWGERSALGFQGTFPDGFSTYLYLSGSTFFTLGLGDVVPRSSLGRILAVLEAGNGLGFLAVLITYLPTLYAAFSKREVNISLLDARAGSPASAGELMRRYAANGQVEGLIPVLAEWEVWAAELMESHISYPVLCYFRSQHANQSWISALTAVLDTCALVMSGADHINPWQARLTFAMARHALVDIAQVFQQAPLPMSSDRLPSADYAALQKSLAEVGLQIAGTREGCSKLKELRDMYEPYAFALGEFLAMPLPPWSQRSGSKDNWTTSAWKSIH